jgi:hypothetical protein
MTAAYILVRLIEGGKSIKEIARQDFDNNLELVSVWIDYMTALNWICKNDGSGNNMECTATDNGKNTTHRYVGF